MAIVLTAKAVEGAKPTTKRQEIPDALLPGLYLVVRPTGRKSWAVRYRADGKSRKLILGPYPLIDLAKVRRDGAAALRGVQEGGDPAREKQEAKKQFQRDERAGRDLVLVLGAQFVERYCKPRNRSWMEV